MGKLIITLNIILISFFLSCKSQTSNFENKKHTVLEKKLVEIALTYIESINGAQQNDMLLCIYIEKENSTMESYYNYRLYNSSILNENLNLPYKYINKEKEENYVLFFFDKQKEIPEKLRENLKRDSLWVSISNIDKMKKKRPVLSMSENEVWDIFFCKKKPVKFKIIKSAYGMEKEDKVIEICN